MPRVNVNLPIALPRWFYRLLQRFEEAGGIHLGRDLSGDRSVEWSFCSAWMPAGPGRALDFGCGRSWIALLAARRGFSVTAVDLEPIQWPYLHPNLRFIQGDLTGLELPKGSFDLILNCSSIEHVGLGGRFGVTKDRPDGDLEAMAILRTLMKPGSIMLLTVPVGLDSVHAPWHRIYGEKRLPRLLEKLFLRCEEYWRKDGSNRWVACDRQEALSFKPIPPGVGRAGLYALGCFVLQLR